MLQLVQCWQTHDARHDILNCHCEDDKYHPDVTPIILAAQRNDFTIVKVFQNFFSIYCSQFNLVVNDTVQYLKQANISKQDKFLRNLNPYLLFVSISQKCAPQSKNAACAMQIYCNLLSFPFGEILPNLVDHQLSFITGDSMYYTKHV